MRARHLIAGLGVLISLAGPAAAQQQGTPLFRDDTLLQLTIQGPLAAIAADRDALTGRPGLIATPTERLPITLAPRGLTRRSRDICDFPPLRVDFPAAPPAGSLFAGQRRLKLVTHCRRNEPHQQYVLLEYAAYRMFNLLTPVSYRARLARIDYLDSGGRPFATRVGFFIEDIDDVARRNGLNRLQAGDRIAVSTLSRREAALAGLFEYMLGNLDWSMRAGPAGEGCCHNFRLLATPGSAAAIPVPYDFDFSGFVDAPYATPPAEFNLSSVRYRKYRGYCIHNAEALAAAGLMRARQSDMLAAVAGVPGISPRTVQRASAYLRDFFAQIASDQSVKDKILSRCAG